ncbi:MAG TPA: 50S ribosomal protein L3 [Candidatus Moranbacteria bacterium]|nr:50S ribosomal protein L3 [Candidatus Moranbacteria bacterium]
MAKFILGRKLGMTTVYDKDKGALNVTLIECEPNTVSLVRSSEKDGYNAAQIEIPKTKNKTHKKEFRLSENKSGIKKGSKITVEIFKEGDKVKISGLSKAKGFQGVVKRHGFSGSPRTHGHKHDLRAPGSIGSAFPEHVVKGKKMAGRMGGKRVSVKNVKVVYINKDKNLIGVKGAVPGVAGRIVEISAN